METTDVQIEKPQTEKSMAEEIPASEMGHSLMALIQTHAKADEAPVEPPAGTLDRLAEGLESTISKRDQLRLSGHTHSLRISEMLHAIGQLLELLHDRLVDNQSSPTLQISPETIEEIHQFIQTSEERQLNMIEAALKHFESERKSQEAERMIHMESLQVQAQIEVNRLLRVIWLGTGLAATGAGTALFLMRT